MGKKVKTISDPSLARSHGAGAVVEFVQIALHDLGMIHIGHSRYWTLHARYANAGCKRLKRYIDKILAQTPSADNVRSVHDAVFITKIYKATFDLVVHTYLTYEHFVLSTLTTIYLYPGASDEDKKKFSELEKLELKEKLRFIIVEILKKPELVTSKGYSMLFVELEQTRHALNHPKNDNTYNCGDMTWDKVPVAWGISGKSLKFFESSADLFNSIYKEWIAIEAQYTKPGVLTGMKRGLRSMHTSFVKKSTR